MKNQIKPISSYAISVYRESDAEKARKKFLSTEYGREISKWNRQILYPRSRIREVLLNGWNNGDSS